MSNIQKAAVLIIGGGPAGLSAAMALSRVQRPAILLDSGVYRNRRAAGMHNVLGHDKIPPLEFLAASRKEIESYGTTNFFQHKAIQITKDSEGAFVVDDLYSAPQIILATGVEDMIPDIPGFAELWGTHIFHCAFCHGYEHKGQRGAVLGYNTVWPALMFSTLDTSFTLLGHGETLSEATTKLRDAGAAGGFAHIPDRVKSIERAPQGHLIVRFDDLANVPPLEIDFMVHAPPTRLHSGELAEQLGLKLTPTGEIEVSGPFADTGVKNVFVGGDNMVLAKAVPGALASGTLAAAASAHIGIGEKLGLSH